MAIDNSQSISLQRNTDFGGPLPGLKKPNQAPPVHAQKAPAPKDPQDLGIDPSALKQSSIVEVPEIAPPQVPVKEQTPATPNPSNLISSPTTLISLESFDSAVDDSWGSTNFSLSGQLGLEAPAESASFLPQGLHGTAQATRSLPGTAEGEAFRKTFVYAQSYDQERVNLPFAYPASPDGRTEHNDVLPTVQGLRHLGAHDAARGILENWLELGERYTALPGKNQLNELGRSGLPRLSTAFLEESKVNPDPDFLPRSYKVLSDDVKQNWGDSYFKATPNGLTRFCDVDYSDDATLDESGGLKNKARFDGDPMPFNPVDLNAYLYRTEKDLQSLAGDLEKRALANGDSEEAAQWKSQGEQWGQKAGARKERILETMWDPQEGLFFDHKFKGKPPTRSEVKTLAAFSVLDAGLLDPSKPEEKGMVDSLVSSLKEFQKAGELPVWDNKGGKTAEAADVLMVCSGLEKYGYKKESQALRQTLAEKLGASSGSESLAEIGARAIVANPGEAAPPQISPEHDLSLQEMQSWMSPQGLESLQRVSPGHAGELKVAAKDAGRLDRRLRSVHSSLKDPATVQQVQNRGLSELVFGVRQEGGSIRPVDVDKEALGPVLNLKEGESVDLGGLHLQTGLQDAEIRRPQEGVAVISKGGHNLVLAKLGDKLIVGDRAYSLSDFPIKSEDGQPQVRLHKDILGSFHMAGDNKQLETFFDANREWVPTAERGKTSLINSLSTKPEWKALNDKVSDNWAALTVAPSVGPKNSAMQIFNPAAVPSLGIFKTQFNWDTLFMAKGMQLQGQQKTVDGMTDNLLYLLKSTGRVPNAARSVYLNKSQPPILPALVRMSTPVREAEQGSAFTEKWLNEAFDAMGKDYMDFWNKPGEGERGVDQIDGQQVRLSRWGGPNHKFAMDESGLDTTSRYYGKALDLVPPDLQGFLFRYANDMSEIAKELSAKATDRGDIQGAQKFTMEAARWKGEAQQRKADTIKYCWDEESGMFRDYKFQGADQGLAKGEDSLSAAFGPLWVGMLDPNVPQEKLMIERSLDNLSKFEKDHGVGSTAEDYGHPEMQWNGPSGWAPHHMIAVEAATRYGRYEEAARITGKWLDTITKVHARDGIILERYDVVRGDHPPVQAGRYEETQGEGPGFGWTNATLPWALVEVIGGARIDKVDNQASFKLEPHIPKELESTPVALDFANPNGQGQWGITHNYSSEADKYSLDLSGDFSQTPVLEVTTPPLSKGQLPKLQGKDGQAAPAYTLREKPAQDGKTRYILRFEGLSGEQTLGLRFARD